MIIAAKDGRVIAWYGNQFTEARVQEMHRDCDIFPWDGPVPEPGGDGKRLDPRSDMQKVTQNAYKLHREMEYPSPEICMLMMYEALKRVEREAQRLRGMNGLEPDQFPHSEFVKLIDEIHARHPKPDG